MALLLTFCFLATASAVSIPEPLILKGPEHASPEKPAIDPQNFWKILSGSLRFNPARDNEYHLFTRDNPTVSQPIVQGLPNTLTESNYGSEKRTVVVIHGMNGDALSHFNQVLVPALLLSADLNMINIDWRIGAQQGTNVINNAFQSGEAVANFINWLMSQTGQTANSFIIVGFSLGGLKSGVVGRHVNGDVSYISAFDPLPQGFLPDDGAYTEAIRTAVTFMGERPVAHADFYVNGGDNNPGCGTDYGCNHSRAYLFFAESLLTGGFTGRRCNSLQEAREGECHSTDTLQMGGLTPKTGSAGLFHLTTNANSPFSIG